MTELGSIFMSQSASGVRTRLRSDMRKLVIIYFEGLEKYTTERKGNYTTKKNVGVYFKS